jgi:hypothetical protein
VDLQAVGFQGTALRKGLFAQVTLVRPNAGVCPGVSLQVECVVEAFAAERAQIPLHVRVTFHVPVEQSLEHKRLGADATGEFVVRFVFVRLWRVGGRDGGVDRHGRLFLVIFGWMMRFLVLA